MDAEAMVLGGVKIQVKSGHGIDPYIDLPMYESTHRWWKIWFFLRNDVAALLHLFMGNRPVPQPNWVQSGQEGPLQVVVLARGHSTVAAGWADARAPSTNHFQPPGSTAPLASDSNVAIFGANCPNHPFSKELGEVEINIRIYKVLVYMGPIRIPGSTAPG
jgi:hypothetical protein